MDKAIGINNVSCEANKRHDPCPRCGGRGEIKATVLEEFTVLHNLKYFRRSGDRKFPNTREIRIQCICKAQRWLKPLIGGITEQTRFLRS